MKRENIIQFSMLVLEQCNPFIMLCLGFIRMDHVIKGLRSIFDNPFVKFHGKNLGATT